MSLKEFEELVQKKDISLMVIELYLNEKGYVVLKQEEYDNLEVIDPDGAVP